MNSVHSQSLVGLKRSTRAGSLLATRTAKVRVRRRHVRDERKPTMTRALLPVETRVRPLPRVAGHEESPGGRDCRDDSSDLAPSSPLNNPSDDFVRSTKPDSGDSDDFSEVAEPSYLHVQDFTTTPVYAMNLGLFNFFKGVISARSSRPGEPLVIFLKDVIRRFTTVSPLIHRSNL